MTQLLCLASPGGTETLWRHRLHLWRKRVPNPNLSSVQSQGNRCRSWTCNIRVAEQLLQLPKLNPGRPSLGRKQRKRRKLSQHGIPYPSLPSQAVRKLASTFARASGNGKTAVTKEVLGAIMQASDWFFEQLSDDLGTYAKHARRRTIDDTYMLTLMRR